MIYQHTCDWVLGVSPHTGKPKRKTRRIAKQGDRLVDNAPDSDGGLRAPMVVDSAGRIRWEVGKTYAVQRGRGIKAEGRIRILRIAYEDVRSISYTDVAAEGFACHADFFKVWCDMHDPLLNFWRNQPGMFQDSVTKPLSRIRRELADRPAERYQAWVLEFELVS